MKTKKRHYGGLSEKELERRKLKEQLSGFCCSEAVEALVNPAADGLALIPGFGSVNALRRFFNRVRDIRPKLKPSQRGLKGGLGNAPPLPEPPKEAGVKAVEPLTLKEVSQVYSLDEATPTETACVVCATLEAEKPLILRRWRYVDEEGKLVWNDDHTPRVSGNFVERKNDEGGLETRCYCGSPNDPHSHLTEGREIDAIDYVDGKLTEFKFRKFLPCFDFASIQGRADARVRALQEQMEEETRRADQLAETNRRIEEAEKKRRDAEALARIKAFRATPRAKAFVESQVSNG